MKYYIIAGEASGDLHGSNLIKELKKLDTNAHFRCWGGDLMNAQGGQLVKHYRDLAFMGFTEVLMNFRTILKNIQYCKKDILAYKPDVLVLIDYPGFNMRIASFAKQNNIKVIYYISPQVWAWKQSRVHKIKSTVDKMMVILPFEKQFYKKFDVDVDFVGHPLLDAISENTYTKINETQRPIIALLPGSRKQEVEQMLPLMLEMKNYFEGYDFVVAGAPSLSEDFYMKFLKDKDVKLVQNKTYNLLSSAHAALVTSGTATLETALFSVPQVVCYKGGALSYSIAKRLVKVNYISLVNLIMDKEVVKELIQDNFNANTLKLELERILQGDKRVKIVNDYKELKILLGGGGASQRAAAIIHKQLI